MWSKLQIVIVVALVIQGCAGGTENSKNSTDALSDIKAVLADDAANNRVLEASKQPPPEVTNALLPQYQSRIPRTFQQETEEERFDVTVNRMNARVFFMSLVRGTPINLVVHPDVTGVISLDLKSVTIDEVLEVTRDVYGYEYQKNRAGYLVLPARLQSKIFNVSYLNVKRKGESNTRVTSGQLATGETDQQQGNNNTSRRRSRGSNTRAFASSKIETESEANFWGDLEATVRTLVGGGEGRSVVVSPQSGLVVVRAMPGELRDVEMFLNNAQKNLQRQVIIEAKVIEVRLDDSFQAGINWVKLNQSAAEAAAGEGDFAAQLKLRDGALSFLDENGNASITSLLEDRKIGGASNIFSFGTVSDDFAAIITLLDQQGDVNVLSSPRVSTVNNQKAVIKVGSDEFFVTEISSTTTTGTSTTTTPEIILTPFFSGIALDVTPQINENEGVILHIHPAISEVVDQVKDITVAGEDQSLPLAFSTVRESDSIVRAKSGQVIIIGGLMQNQIAETEGGIPGLKSIPVLGNLFKQKRRKAVRSELVILLKPTVIGDDGNYWRSELEQISGRINNLSR